MKIDNQDRRLIEKELVEQGIVLSAYKSFRGARRPHIAYVSLPVTTGQRYFETLRHEGVFTATEFEKKVGTGSFYELVIKPNIKEGVALADKLGHKKNLLFIAPSIFDARKWNWSQDTYMSLWYAVIGELAGAHYLQSGWEYSLGSVKEIFFSNLMRWGIIRPFTKQFAIDAFGLSYLQTGLTRDEEWREFEAMRNIKIF